jgi:eukaryotic-like serine/threonine-protein kinase
MNNALESSGSDSRSETELFSAPEVQSAPQDRPQGEDTRTVSFIPILKEGGSSDIVNEEDKTVISQRPVAAPEEFYRSMPLAELAAMLEGKQLDHFAVETMIGGGGMGAVFRGVDNRLDRVVAVKVIPASKRDPETLRRFRLEAQAAARLDHPNIARVYYVGEANQWNYIVFEFIDGINIRDLVDLEGPLSIDDAVFYTRQVAEALQHAHERDVVHRDVKPSNLLVTANGIAKLVDMGLARDTSLDKSTADATASGVTLGTFDYISPEQARNPRDADVRSDLYSLGCTLFFMLTGHPPFPDGTALQKLLNHGSQPPPDPRGWREDISDQLYEVMMKLMAKRPADRYQKPRDLVNDLLMLAELENLPRSQGPSTLMVSPSVAQRSLLESNLPWIVAVSFLLGSTLWLQSLQTLSNGITLQELKFSALPTAAASLNEPTVGQPTEPTDGPSKDAMPLTDEKTPEVLMPVPDPSVNTGAKANVELPNLGAGPAAMRPPDFLVVSTTRPNDVPFELWEPSLAIALERLTAETNPSELPMSIEIRGTVSLPRPLRLVGINLQIRNGDASALIEIDPSLLEDFDSNAAISVQDSKLRLSGIKVRTTASSATPKTSSLFQVLGNSSLSMDSCSMTVQEETQGGLPNEFFVVHIGSNGDNGLAMADETTNAETKSIVLSMQNSVIRGASSLIGISKTKPSHSPRLELSFEDVLVAIDGVGIDLRAGTGEFGEEQIVRLFCKQSTFVTSRGFASLNYEGEGTPLIELNRNSRSCVYWSAANTPHISIAGASAGLLENPNLLLLQGYDNAYDTNIEYICQTFSAGSPLFDLRFSDGQQEGWLAERSTERTVRWQQSVAAARPFSEAQVTDFRLIEGMFVPGFRNDSPPPPRVE